MEPEGGCPLVVALPVVPGDCSLSLEIGNNVQEMTAVPRTC